MNTIAFVFVQKPSRDTGGCSAQARLIDDAYSLLQQKENPHPSKTTGRLPRRIRRADLIEREERKLSLIDNNLTKHC